MTGSPIETTDAVPAQTRSGASSVIFSCIESRSCQRWLWIAKAASGALDDETLCCPSGRSRPVVGSTALALISPSANRCWFSFSELIAPPLEEEEAEVCDPMISSTTDCTNLLATAGASNAADP